MATLVLICPRDVPGALLESDAAGASVRQQIERRIHQQFADVGPVALATAITWGELAGDGRVLIVDDRAWFPVDSTIDAMASRCDESRLFRIVGSQAKTLAVLVERSVLLTEAGHGSLQDVCNRILDGTHPHTAERPTVLSTGILVDGWDDVARLETAVLKGRAEAAMASGVRLRDPERVYIRGVLACGANVTVDTDVIFEGNVRLGDGVRVDAHCILRDANIRANTWVKAFSLVEDADVGAGCVVGPYARIRPRSSIGDSCQVGNFVEIKSSTIGAGSRINHHSFIGDAILADRVTIGAGTITCNHDGTTTNQTIIGRDAYIGSGCQLVAPLRVGDSATIGAGSTITEDVPPATLTVARSRQVTISGWRGPRSNRRE